MTQALRQLRQAVGNDEADFREGQWEAISALVQRNARLLVVQRTGWGKSLVYFLATRFLRDRGAGYTLLVGGKLLRYAFAGSIEMRRHPARTNMPPLPSPRLWLRDS